MAFIFVDSDNSLAIKDVYDQRKVVSDIGGYWDPVSKLWRVTFTTYNLDFLLNHLENPSVSADMEELVQKQVEKETRLTRLREMSKEDVPVRFKIPGLKGNLYNYQRLGVMFATLNGVGTLLADEMGLGKEVPVETPVLGEHGWRPVGGVAVGDRVYGRDGGLHRVTGVFPQGVKEIVRVTFSDGVCSECGWDHLWMVMSNNDAVRGMGWRVLDTRTLANDLTFGRKKPVFKWRIPLAEPAGFSSAWLVVPPYLMGVLLGDGSLTSGGLSFCPGEDEVPAVVSSMLPRGYKVRKGANYGTSTRFYVVFGGNGNPMSREITRMGLRVPGERKFIPGEYKFSDVSQRKELLAGLLDTDGSAMGARTRFSTSSERLADDVAELVMSLGGMAVKSLVPGRRRMRGGKAVMERNIWQLTIDRKSVV